MKTLKYAWRFLMRSKSYTVINLLGLALSLACCIILVRYIHRELTVDTHCVDRRQVYGIKVNMEGDELLSNIEQRDSVFIDERYIESRTSFIPLEQDYVMLDANRYPARVIVTDSVFFQLFRYPVVQGDISLRSPHSALLTKAFAHKIFGKENPIGKVLRYANGKDVIVEGILGEPSNKTSVQFDVVLSSMLSDRWQRMSTGYIRFTSGTNIDDMNKIGSISRPVNPPGMGDTRMYTFSFIPIEEIYWNPVLTSSEPLMFYSGNHSYLFILIGVCLLLLFTGILNFINIYLVAMLRRGKEYGLKKVFGAKGKSLFLQIWLENMLLVLAALLFAWFIIEITSVPVEWLFSYSFTYTGFDWGISLGILLLLPFATSIYPYIKYNYASPILSISSIGWGKHSVRSRMFFLFTQYIFTFLLVVLSLYFNKQLGMLLNTEPGYRTKDVIIANLVYESKDFKAYTEESRQRRQHRVMEINQALSACPFIEEWDASRYSIVTPTWGTYFLNDKGEKIFFNVRYATPKFFQLFNIKCVEGTLPDFGDGNSRGVIVVNRAAMKALKYTTCEGAGLIEENAKRYNANAPLSPIVAVVEDYYTGHLSLGKQPTLFMVNPRMSGDQYHIAHSPGKRKEVLEYLQKIESKVYGSENFEYSILEDEVKAMYKEDNEVATIYSVFAGVAIIISSLGLFGISLFDIRQRYREIAIRKVNGASVNNLYVLLFRKYIFVLAGAFVISVPLACYLINIYTLDLVVKAPMGIGIFIVSLFAVMLISLGTLMWQVRKAANINPAKIMKTE